MNTPHNRNDLYRRFLNGDKLTDFPIIDGHGHLNFFVSPPLDQETTDIVRVMDSCCIDRAVVFHCGPKSYTMLNDITLEGISCFPERLIGYAFINMSEGQEKALHELDRCRQKGMKGLKLHRTFETDQPFTGKAFGPLWKFCAESGWPVIIHGMPLELAYDNPDTIFIGAHHIESINSEKHVQAAHDCPNYYWCTSATFCQMGAIEKAVNLFGADKLLFGSDFDGNDMSIRMGSVLTAKISEIDAKKILGGNIAGILNLEIRDRFPM